MSEQEAGGYTLDVSDDIAGNPAVVMQDECHNCGEVVPVAEQTNEVQEAGGVNVYDFIIDPSTGKSLNIFSKVGRNLLKSMVNNYIELNKVELEGGDLASNGSCDCCVEGHFLDPLGPSKTCYKKNMSGGEGHEDLNDYFSE